MARATTELPLLSPLHTQALRNTNSYISSPNRSQWSETKVTPEVLWAQRSFSPRIDPAESKTSHTARDVEMKLRKKELGETYWPRLLKDTKKAHFLKTDFDKWVDEDEQNEAPEDDFGANFGGPGGMGMGGLPGMGGGDFGGIDFSKLGGGAGMPTGDEDEDESDDDMPPLEGEEEPEKAAKADDGKEAVASS
ncbi:hypothetical protein CHGG_07870 [Chaetomium globosum CBS 148.51]|uniref:CS domain-containing protein n=1 Tax=Chaetomium globosum (strain ATCC 6205 / CBS 148.51 / DSM 1962 / NBRC 6347 / NRRL 1970) TaxID=306901 RepID=Q2GVY4_CHAGB|nr:uncharacterized protein CHGG_07870 [Chaetomium globosum CBS 148.51]EAQ86617.1 hypothetical protein CHGG_07870 [Chaetomium globosum CBS 148.51]